jgi:glycosyltransferase involved in cell wall biosynthesis
LQLIKQDRKLKKVLIISYYWPPAGGVGVLRCLKFSKYLRQFGWEPIIYAPSNADYLYYDYSNLKDIPNSVEILRHPIREPYKLYKLLSGRKKNDPTDPVHVRQKISYIDNFSIWIRGNFFIPDARCLWINPSVRYLTKYLRTNKVDAIFTDGPPHTNTVIGQKLSSRLAIPWLADFQDPWTQADYYKLYKISKWADNRHKKMEQVTFNTAHKITTASPSWAKDLKTIGAKNVDVLYYGFDEDDFCTLTPIIDADFTITHTGLLSPDRNPEVLFRVLKDIKNELPGFGEKLKLNFVGAIDFKVKKSIAENGLQQNFNDMGFIDRGKTIQLTLNAQLLLLPLNKSENVNGRIPGKFYEYVRAKRPILCLGPKDSDVAMILKEHEAGECIGYDDYEQIKTYVKGRYELFLEGENNITSISFEKYSIENQARILSQYLNQILK